MKKIGILHISDVHIDKASISDIDSLVKKLIEDINTVKKENNVEIDLVCFAGDLISRGDKAFSDEMQIELAEKHFIEPILTAMELSNREFILVPGNHEVNRNEIASMTEKGLSTISSLNEINETILDMKPEYKKRLQYFYDYMCRKYIPDAKTWNLGYSVIKKIKDTSIGIVGLDSAWRSTGSGCEERGKMLVGEQQVGVLHDNIKDTDLKICLMHHPLDWLSDLEMMNVEGRLKCFDLVLRGHVHDLNDKQICTQKYKTIYNTSGKLYPIDSYYSGYSILDIDMDLSTCCIYSREYLKAPRENFDKALRINENGNVKYQLTYYDDGKAAEYDLKLQLKKYYEDMSDKYGLLKKIDDQRLEKTSDFFVEPIIYEKSDYERAKLSKKEDLEEKIISLKSIINSNENILVIGKKEGGKTTLLQRIGILYVKNNSEKIPVYIDMMKLPKVQDRIFVACQTFIFSNISLDVSINKNHIRHMLSSGRIVCLFDNVNLSNADHIVWIQSFISSYPNNRFIFAAEENFYQTYTLKDLPDFGIRYKTVYLQYFGKKQVREMLTKWGNGKEEFDVNKMTQKIVTYCNNINFVMTPFNIAVFMTIWDGDRNFVPINEGKVMRKYLETVLDRFSVEDFQRSEYDYDVKQHFLGYLAYEMCKKDEYFFTIDEFNQLTDQYHQEKGFQKSKSKFDVIFFQKNILCLNGEYVYFCNTSIMEYCLASFAVVDSTLYKLMTGKETRRNFAREISFYSGIVQDCSKLVNDLSDEITVTILNNMSILEEVEKLSIGIEFNVERDTFTETLVRNRRSIEEIDEIESNVIVSEDLSPMEISKNNIDFTEESESFRDLLLIYGNVIKNFETADRKQKKIHLENYVLGMNFQFGLIINKFSMYLTSKTKEELPSEIKEKHPNLTDEDYEKVKENVLDLIKMVLPIAFQISIANNVGTPKLELIINELINDNKNKKFTRFMLSFLLCDIGNGNVRTFLLRYIKEEDSKDILKLILIKLEFYYSTWYFGNNSQVDDILLDLITEVQIKLSGQDGLKLQIRKGDIKNRLKKSYDTQRRKKQDL